MTKVIAIDGPVGSGKSTVARLLAEKLGWSFLDTGAMYRAVSVLALKSGVELSDEVSLAKLARNCHIETLPSVVINGEDVTNFIRTEQINVAVSVVAQNSEVRREMVKRQREFANEQPIGTVVEGRDITTVVFPEATLKIFLTADPDERARRRGDESPQSIIRRDEVDSGREISPLAVAPDAVVIDTTNKTPDLVVSEIVECLSNQN
jgi:CMP/dCMP kinase